MTQVFASLMFAGCVATLAVVGLPKGQTERECHGARRGSIVGIANCPHMAEQVRVEPVG